MKDPYKLYLRKAANQYFPLGYSGGGLSSTPQDIGAQHNVVLGLQAAFGRDFTYWGVFRNYAPEMRFIGDAASIVRYVYSTEGAEGVCQLEIWGLNHVTQQYEYLFVMDMDFSEYKSEDLYVDVGFQEPGIKAKLYANATKRYQLPLFANSSVVNVSVHGLKTQSVYRYISYPFTYTGVIGGVNSGVLFYFPLTYYSREGYLDDALATDQAAWVTGGEQPVNELSGFRAKVDMQVTVTIPNETITFSLANGVGSTIKLRVLALVFNPNSPLLQTATHVMYIDPGAGITGGGSVTFSNISPTATFNMTAGQKLIIVYGFTIVSGSGLSGTVITNTGSSGVKIETNFSVPVTKTATLPAWKAFEQLSFFVAQQQLTGTSPYLNLGLPASSNYWNQPIRTVLTSGMALRGVLNSYIETSLEEFVKNAKSVWGLGMGIENNQFVLDKLIRFYRKDILTWDLGENVNEVQFSEAKDLIGTSYKNGYTNFSNDDLNGQNVVNAEMEHALPFVRTNREIDEISPYCADCFQIDVVRSRRVLSGDDRDNGSDKQVFLLEYDATLQINGAFGLFRPPATLTGVSYGSTMYNYTLTPKMNFYRNGQYLRSICHLRDTSQIKWLRSSKNDALQTAMQNNGQTFTTVIEKSDVNVNSLGAHLFYPIYIDLLAAIDNPHAFLAAVNTNPYGVIRFTFKGKVFEGFIVDIDLLPEIPSERRFKLLCSPNVNMANFVW